MLPIPSGVWDDYHSLSEHIVGKIPETATRLQRSVSLDTWKECITSPGGFSLKGSLVLGFNGTTPRPTARLDPVTEQRDGSSFRLGRAFGGDRFLAIDVSCVDETSLYQKANFRGWLKGWLMDEKTFLNRTWRALFVREKKKSPNCYEVKLFATSGRGLSGPTGTARPSVFLEDVIHWLIPLSLEENKAMPASKIYSRLELGFSKTYPAIEFRPSQIHEVDDEHGDEAEEDLQFNDPSLDWSRFLDSAHTSSRIMSDGCARISVAAAALISKYIGTAESVPSAFQGRIGNAKGLWVKSIDRKRDAQDPIWIETTASQRKFVRHEEDRDDAHYNSHRTTFDLLAWSDQLSSSQMSVSLLGILHDRGVSKSSIAQLVRTQMDFEKDIFFDALEDPASLLKWISTRLPGAPSDNDPSSLQASMPKLRSERITRLVRAGFQPFTCYYLSDLIKKGFDDWLNRLGNRLEIRIPHSTFAFGVADFQHVLKPGEIFLSFSRALPGVELPCLYERDVLVARYPMHRPSDVQKVRAIYHPKLVSIQDVVVFSARGGFPLAEKLSNGDYDGDRYWVCWEPSLVRDFKNAPPPDTVEPELLGIHVESEPFRKTGEIDGLLKKSFDLRISEKMLGVCSNYQERYVYETNDLGTPEMALLSDLRDCLVDGPKNGYRFTMKDWNSFLDRGKYPRKLDEPAYKQSIERPRGYKEDNIIDYVKFAVMRESLRDFKTEVQARLQHVPGKDENLSGLYTDWYDSWFRGEDDEVLKELWQLANNLITLVSDWKKRRSKNGGGTERYDEDIEQAYLEYQQITPSKTTHPVVASWMDRPVSNGFTTWDLLKASALHTKIVDQKMSHFIFSLAGRELLFMKALAVDPNTQFVTSDIMSRLKVKRTRNTGSKP